MGMSKAVVTGGGQRSFCDCSVFCISSPILGLFFMSSKEG